MVRIPRASITPALSPGLRPPRLLTNEDFEHEPLCRLVEDDPSGRRHNVLTNAQLDGDSQHAEYEPKACRDNREGGRFQDLHELAVPATLVLVAAGPEAVHAEISLALRGGGPGFCFRVRDSHVGNPTQQDHLDED